MLISKNKKLVLLALLMFLTGLSCLFFDRNPAPRLQDERIPSSALIPYDSAYNFRQTVNDCGPFNVAAVVRVLKNEQVSSEEFASEMEWRLPNDYTLPQGLEKQLKENGINIQTPDVKGLTDEEKIKYLQQELSQNHPIILLGERDEFIGSPYEHYITLLGFDAKKDEFYVYDSFYEKAEEGMTIDSNQELPGNRNYSSAEILEFWGKGGMFGLYKSYLIVAWVN